MKSKHRFGLPILAGGLAFVGSASAVDLITNGSFELEAFPSSPGGTPTGWTGFIRTYNYSQAYYKGPAIPGVYNPGTIWTWQHRAVQGVDGAAGVAQVTQTVDLTLSASSAQIDAGGASFTYSAWLASYGQPSSNPERALLTLQFFDAGSMQVGSTVTFDRALGGNFAQFADGTLAFDTSTHEHHWAQYVNSAAIPVGARTATVGIGRNATSGLSGTPDTYVDLVSLEVVPEPSTWGLLGLGTFSLLFYQRRRS